MFLVILVPETGAQPPATGEETWSMAQFFAEMLVIKLYVISWKEASGLDCLITNSMG